MELVEPIERKLLFPQTYSSRAFYGFYHEVVPARGNYEGEEVVGINFFAAKKWDMEIKALFPQLVYSRYFDYAVDVMPVMHLKGEAVIDVLRHYGFKKEESLWALAMIFRTSLWLMRLANSSAWEMARTK
jgi:hydroxymethylpyrimidine pyrophosphatase-like HAD family hydrolase